MKPTVIRSNEPPDEGKKKTVRPTVIPTTSAPQPTEPVVQKTTRFTPTVIKQSQVTTAVITDIPEPQPHRTISISTPTTIPGVVRKRIELKAIELSQYASGAKLEVLERTLGVLLVTNIEDLTQRSAILWGNDLQTKYGTLVSKSLELAQSTVLSKVSGHIDRMTDILGSINLRSVCGFGKVERSLFRSLFASEPAKIETLAELREAQIELDQLVKLLGIELHALLNLKDAIEDNSRHINELGDEVEVWAVASAFLADYLGRTAPEKNLASIFSDRNMSLTQTLAQIRSGDSMREIQIDKPLRLISSVQHVVQVMLPGWLGSIVSLRTTLEARRKVTITEIDELGDQTQQIIEQLKKEK